MHWRLPSAKLVTQGSLTLSLVGKVAAVTACTTSFVFSLPIMLSSEQNLCELRVNSRELNLSSRGQLATTQLGKQIFHEPLWDAVVASVCGVVGSVIALTILTIALAIPLPIIGVGVTIAILGVLGWLLGLSVFGSATLWAGGLILRGNVVTAIGAKLNILG
jgi:hypothetical protein